MGFFKKIIKKEVSKQFFRFCFIGITITIFSYLLFLILYYFLSIHYVVSAGVGYVGGVLLGFIFNKIYTFESKRKSSREILQYFFVYGFSLIFTMISIKYLVETISFNPLIANLILQPFIVLINFFGTKVLVFKNKKW